MGARLAGKRTKRGRRPPSQRSFPLYCTVLLAIFYHLNAQCDRCAETTDRVEWSRLDRFLPSGLADIPIRVGCRRYCWTADDAAAVVVVAIVVVEARTLRAASETHPGSIGRDIMEKRLPPAPSRES